MPTARADVFSRPRGLAHDEIALGGRRRGPNLILWVRDTGPGVAPQDRAHVFERFVRGRCARRRFEEAGLGLPIVRAIAEAHGGKVTLSDAPGDGALFTFVLPVLEDKAVLPTA